MEQNELSYLDERKLVEYQTAQDSAQHHDNLVWTTSGLIWGSSLVLLGFVLDNLSNQPNKLFILGLSLLSILMYIALLIFSCQFADIKRQKYNRCKEIEEELKLKQHSSLKYEGGVQRVFYIIINSVFIIFWILVMLKVCCS